MNNPLVCYLDDMYNCTVCTTHIFNQNAKRMAGQTAKFGHRSVVPYSRKRNCCSCFSNVATVVNAQMNHHQSKECRSYAMLE
uniref:Uncharacterized protein n=1 Tax=Arundo donax TaxID=35708 RepID=A0A0A9VCT6_ARUDO